MSLNDAVAVSSAQKNNSHADVSWGDEEEEESGSRQTKEKQKQKQKQTKATEKQTAADDKVQPAEAEQTSAAQATAEADANAGGDSDPLHTLIDGSSGGGSGSQPDPYLSPATAAAGGSTVSASSAPLRKRSVPVEDDASPVQVLPVPASVIASTRAARRSGIAAFEQPPIARSPDFIHFRAWSYYDCGPKTGVPPLICIPGTSGTAESFFHQVMSLGNRGYRVIAVSPPAYWTCDEWCNGFNGFLAALKLTEHAAGAAAAGVASSSSTAASTLDGGAAAAVAASAGKVHVFATSLAGYLCLYYLSHILPSKNHIASLILCNSFLDTLAYQERGSAWCLALLKRAPDFLVRKLVLDALPSSTAFPEAVDFTVEQLESSLPAEVLASRLTLNVLRARAVASPPNWRDRDGGVFPQERVTIMDTTDESVVPEAARARLYDALPHARYALLKHGGDMPWLSVPDEVNMHLQVHLRSQGIFPSIRDVASPTAASGVASPAAAAAADGGDDLPPPTVVHLSALPASPPDSDSSSSAAAAAAVASASASSAAASLHLLRPEAWPHGKLPPSGYGHENDEFQNDSIFLSKNASASPPVAAHASGSSTPPQSRGAGLSLSGIPDAERAALERIRAEEAERAERIAAAAAERKAAEAALAAQERARLAAEAAVQERHSSMLSSLIDADGEAAAEEARLTAKRQVVKRNTDDLF